MALGCVFRGARVNERANGAPWVVAVFGLMAFPTLLHTHIYIV